MLSTFPIEFYSIPSDRNQLIEPTFIMFKTVISIKSATVTPLAQIYLYS